MPPDNTVFETYREITGSAEEYDVRARALETLDLNFFGVPVRLHLRSVGERGQWDYFFKYFRADEPTNPIYEFWPVVDGGDASFIESIFAKDYVTKSLYLRVGKTFYLWVRFDGWSYISSPLPPFSMPPLNGRVSIVHASAAVPKGYRRAIVFLAQPYQGKSTLVNALLHRGATPLADNLAVFDAQSGKVLPYLTPTGIREETVALIPGLAEAVRGVAADRITVSEVTGTVYLLHFDEITVHPPSQPAPPGLFVFLRNERGSGRQPEIEHLSRDAAARGIARFHVDSSMPVLRRWLPNILAATPAITLCYDLAACRVDAILNMLDAEMAE